jgi:hypothetical protein
MGIMAKPGTWVGLDTNATAGRNGNAVKKMNSNCGVALLVHDDERIVARKLSGRHSVAAPAEAAVPNSIVNFNLRWT